jgi:hypothetical protein
VPHKYQSDTLKRHQQCVDELVIKDLNRRLAEIVISTIKYPVFIDVDIRIHLKHI